MHNYIKYYTAEPSYEVKIAAAVCEAQVFCTTCAVCIEDWFSCRSSVVVEH